MPQVHITNFVIYDEENHLVSIDSGILSRNHQLKLDGYAKPIYNLDSTLTGGDYVKEVSGVSSWFITGFTEEDNIRIGLVRCDGSLGRKGGDGKTRKFKIDLPIFNPKIFSNRW